MFQMRNPIVAKYSYHESGHVVLSRLLGIKYQFCTILSGPFDVDGERIKKLDGSGNDLFGPVGRPLDFSGDSAEKYNEFAKNDCISAAGGYIAECLFLDQVDEEASGYDKDAVEKEWPGKYEFYFSNTFPDSKVEKIDFKNELNWQMCCSQAKEIISPHATVVEDFAKVLYKEHTVNYDRIEAFFNSINFLPLNGYYLTA